MRFRPCIDLHEGKVKQIVGATFADDGAGMVTNYVADRPPAYYAELYKGDGLAGGHVIMLGPGNDRAALEALRAYPQGLQAGGGITPENARSFLDAGASHVIVTSYVFRDGRIDTDRLTVMSGAVGKKRLVLDLSCRKRDGAYHIVTDRWRTFTAVTVCEETLAGLARFCDEFLVHAADVEGRRGGIDAGLAAILGDQAPLPVTYAGGIRDLADLDALEAAGKGRVDATVGSALDIFGGDLGYRDVVRWHDRRNGSR